VTQSFLIDFAKKTLDKAFKSTIHNIYFIFRSKVFINFSIEFIRN